MAKQDTYVRYTIRLPADLHAQLAASTGDASLNSDIIRRLQESVERPVVVKKLDAIMAHLGIKED